MQFKNTKKETSKKAPSKSNVDSLKKEEIKEIVEETVEEVLKEQSEAGKKTDVTLEKEDTKEEKSVEAEDTDTKESDNIILSDTPFENNAKALPPLENQQPEKAQPEEGKDTLPPAIEPTTEQPEGIPVQAVSPIAVSPFSTPQPPGDTGIQKESSQKSSRLKFFIIFVLLGFLAGGVLWLVVFHNVFGSKLPKIPGLSSSVLSPTQAPTLIPSPTPAPVAVSSVKVAVLNGSGVAGAAAKAKDLLTQAGFSVDTVGNASSSDFTQTVIAAKSSVSKDIITSLSSTLGKTYDVSTQVLSVDDSQADDIIVTLGSSTK